MFKNFKITWIKINKNNKRFNKKKNILLKNKIMKAVKLMKLKICSVLQLLLKKIIKNCLRFMNKLLI